MAKTFGLRGPVCGAVEGTLFGRAARWALFAPSWSQTSASLSGLGGQDPGRNTPGSDRWHNPLEHPTAGAAAQGEPFHGRPGLATRRSTTPPGSAATWRAMILILKAKRPMSSAFIKNRPRTRPSFASMKRAPSQPWIDSIRCSLSPLGERNATALSTFVMALSRFTLRSTPPPAKSWAKPLRDIPAPSSSLF